MRQKPTILYLDHSSEIFAFVANGLCGVTPTVWESATITQRTPRDLPTVAKLSKTKGHGRAKHWRKLALGFNRSENTTALMCVRFAGLVKERLTSVPCVICAKPVRLEECTTNDLGEPVHEACYAERLKDEAQKQKAATTRP